MYSASFVVAILMLTVLSCFVEDTAFTLANVIKSDEQTTAVFFPQSAGANRTSEINELHARIDALTEEFDKLFRTRVPGVPSTNALQQHRVSSTSGATYVRWGRTECPIGSSSVYQGYAGSSGSAALGGGSNIICLHEHPNEQTDVSKIPTTRSYIRGVEYKFGDLPFSTSSNGGRTLLNNDMPCVVCQATERYAQFMLPGRSDCPDGWLREYWGYLVSAHLTQQRGQYTCLDTAPEAIPNGQAALTNTNMVFPVESECISGLVCPPYDAGKGISCVVCSK